MLRKLSLSAIIALALSSAAHAEFQFSAYGGYQSAPHSDVTITGTNPQSFTAGWEGRSFVAPPFWGVRGTWWVDQMPNWGVSVDFTHAKVYADSETFLNDIPTWSRFEFSDGINILTVNAMRRFQQWNNFRPYVGAGVGLSIPHVEVFRPSGRTFEYQVGGAAFQGQLGVEYDISERFSVFTEYKANYTINNVTIDNGDKLKTNIITNAFIAGVSVRF